MKSINRSVTLSAIIVASANGFSTVSTNMPTGASLGRTSFGISSSSSSFSFRNPSTFQLNESLQNDQQDDEIDRLRSMAAKLRAEASALEVRNLYAFSLYI